MCPEMLLIIGRELQVSVYVETQTDRAMEGGAISDETTAYWAAQLITNKTQDDENVQEYYRRHIDILKILRGGDMTDTEILDLIEKITFVKGLPEEIFDKSAVVLKINNTVSLQDIYADALDFTDPDGNAESVPSSLSNDILPEDPEDQPAVASFQQKLLAEYQKIVEGKKEDVPAFNNAFNGIKTYFKARVAKHIEIYNKDQGTLDWIRKKAIAMRDKYNEAYLMQFRDHIKDDPHFMEWQKQAPAVIEKLEASHPKEQVNHRIISIHSIHPTVFLPSIICIPA